MNAALSTILNKFSGDTVSRHHTLSVLVTTASSADSAAPGTDAAAAIPTSSGDDGFTGRTTTSALPTSPACKKLASLLLPATPRLTQLHDSNDTLYFESGDTRGLYHNLTVTLGKKIGRGQYGTVQQATLRYTHNGITMRVACAAKHIRDNTDCSTIPQEMRDHNRLTCVLELPSIESGLLRLIGIYHDCETKKYYALMPLGEATLAGCKKRILQMREEKSQYYHVILFELFSAMVNALNCLKQAKVVHGDIKPANIVFYHGQSANSRIRPCLFDFGAVTQDSSTPVGTPLYQSPELMSFNPRHITTSASDIWACGTILHEFLGADIVPKDALGLDITNVSALRRKKQADYQTAQECALSCDASTHQAIILKEITSYTVLLDAMRYMQEAMCATLEAQRPTVETLQRALAHIDTLREKLPEEAEKRMLVDAYQDALQNANTPGQRGAVDDTLKTDHSSSENSNDGQSMLRTPQTTRSLFSSLAPNSFAAAMDPQTTKKPPAHLSAFWQTQETRTCRSPNLAQTYPPLHQYPGCQ